MNSYYSENCSQLFSFISTDIKLNVRDVMRIITAMIGLACVRDDVALDPDEVTVPTLVRLRIRVNHDHMSQQVPSGAGRVQRCWFSAKLKTWHLINKTYPSTEKWKITTQHPFEVP